MKKILFVAFVLLASIISLVPAADFMAPSDKAPGGLETSNVPQFVILGFDDNLSAAGMQWILDYIDSLKNPAGKGNTKTYDGASVRCSFYCNTANGFSHLPSDLVAQEKRAYTMGNEIGDHTAHHWHSADSSASSININVPAENWASEVSLAKHELVDSGISTIDNVVAFRTPFLEYTNALFPVLKDSGFVYDCSIEEGSQANQNGTNYLWPYTLDNGSPGHNASWLNDPSNPNHFSVDGVAGLWELPNHLVIVPPDSVCAQYGVDKGFRAKVALSIVGGDSTGDNKDWYDDIRSNGKITGFDYNFWTSKASNGAAMNKAEVLAVLKYTLDLRLAGNRAPFMIGAHTQFYTQTADAEEDFPNAKYQDRQAAIEEFITYALSKSEVRMVPGIKVIEWMRDPVGFDGDTSNNNGVDTTNPSGNLVGAGWEVGLDEYGSTVDTGTVMFANGEIKADFTIKPVLDTTPDELDQWTYGSVTTYLDTNLVGLTYVKVTYKSDKTVNITLPQPPLDNEGTSYMYALNSTTDFKTVLIPLTSFAQPSWIDNSQKADLDLSKVTSVSFEATADGAKQSIEIKELVLYGTSVVTPIDYVTAKGMKNFNIRNITSSSANFVVPVTGNYSLTIYGLNGRKIAVPFKGLAKAGLNGANFTKLNIANSIYFAVLEGKGFRTVSKIKFNK